MKPGFFHIVPAGKRPNIKKPIQYKQKLKKIKAWLSAKKMRGPYYIIAAALTVTTLLGLHSYMSNYVYVVLLNDHEIGIVNDADEVEKFVADLTGRCSDLYDMRIEPGQTIALVKEYRPGSIADPEKVANTIRQQLTLLTDAYMLTVDGTPFVPVISEGELATVIDLLKVSYNSRDSGVKVLDAYIIEDLNLEACVVSPDTVHSAEEVVSLLFEVSRPQTSQASLISDAAGRSLLDSRQLYSYENIASHTDMTAEILSEKEGYPSNNTIVHVNIMEEVTVIETIPFAVEYEYDDEMWVVQKEITVLGEEGKKELVYHIIRENGVEIERSKVNEVILEHPVTQVELHGVVKVPSMGTGQFIWPVETGGEVTPGRGFNSWHTGIDIGGNSGINILAADSGVVWFSGYGGSQGNYLIIYHGPYWTLYLHNSENLVSKGDEVVQGEIIALLGSTGRSSGPHLHFEVRLDDGSGEWHAYYQHIPVDPLQYFIP